MRLSLVLNSDAMTVRKTLISRRSMSRFVRTAAH